MILNGSNCCGLWILKSISPEGMQVCTSAAPLNKVTTNCLHWRSFTASSNFWTNILAQWVCIFAWLHFCFLQNDWRFVRTLKVCELDIIFNFEKAYFILDELLIGGEIQETSKKSVLKAIAAQDLLQEVDEGKSNSYLGGEELWSPTVFYRNSGAVRSSLNLFLKWILI